MDRSGLLFVAPELGHKTFGQRLTTTVIGGHTLDRHEKRAAKASTVFAQFWRFGPHTRIIFISPNNRCLKIGWFDELLGSSSLSNRTAKRPEEEARAVVCSRQCTPPPAVQMRSSNMADGFDYDVSNLESYIVNHEYSMDGKWEGHKRSKTICSMIVV